MTWIVAVLVYLSGHFATYAIFTRHWFEFQSERAIFGYHFCSVLALAGVLGVAPTVSGNDQALAIFVAGLGVHTIYSVALLELWSLTQGSYSLTILAYIARSAASSDVVGLGPLSEVAQVKQRARLQGLEQLGLICHVGDYFALTRRGRFCAAVLQGIAWPAGLKGSI